MDAPNGERNDEIAAMSLLLSEFHDGAPLFSSEVFDTTSEARNLLGKKEDVEGFQDSWAFDRLPYADLARNSSPPPSEVFDTTSEVFDNDISKDQRDNIFFRHFDFRPRRITKEEHMKSALESNTTSEASGNNNVMI
jgi:hypothetical protein